MSADPVRLQLGELLVHKGVLTDEQLELALAEQRQSGSPLGEILVRLGFANPPTIANALADQHGGPLRTEYGLSIGPTHAVPRPVTARPDTREQDTAIVHLHSALDEKTEELARAYADLAGATDQIATLTAELAEARRELGVQQLTDGPPDDRHLLFVPGPEGYTMVERGGPAPEVGAVIELGAVSFAVLRVGPSTLLGVPMRCALLARS